MEKNFREVKEELATVKTVKAALEEKTAALFVRVEELQTAMNEQKEDLSLRGKQLEILYDMLDKLAREIAEPGKHTLQTGREITQTQVDIISKHLSHIFKYMQVFNNELAAMKMMVKPVFDRLKAGGEPTGRKTQEEKQADDKPSEQEKA
jgi:uncharacterized coiled-coil protein SlyX